MATRSTRFTHRTRPRRGPPLGSVADVEAALSELCRAYGHHPVTDVIARGQQLLATTETVLDRPVGRSARQRLLVASGWVWALLGCTNFDAGRRAPAQCCREAVRDVAEETRHSELAAWAWELTARFALADRRFSLASAAAEAGDTLTVGDQAVSVRLALHQALAAARLGDHDRAKVALDRAGTTVDRVPRDEGHCFGVDRMGVATGAAAALLWLGEDAAAEDYAWQALVRTVSPDGATDYGAGRCPRPSCRAGRGRVRPRPRHEPVRRRDSRPGQPARSGRAVNRSRVIAARYCTSCGARLAVDTPSTTCPPCRQQASQLLAGPPPVPAQFWTIDRMRDALANWHMGQIITAYRRHPHHGRPLSQELVGGWVGLTQAQISRIENGPPITDLDRLTAWARTLRIPADLLWFRLPDHHQR